MSYVECTEVVPAQTVDQVVPGRFNGQDDCVLVRGYAVELWRVDGGKGNKRHDLRRLAGQQFPGHVLAAAAVRKAGEPDRLLLLRQAQAVCLRFDRARNAWATESQHQFQGDE